MMKTDSLLQVGGCRGPSVLSRSFPNGSRVLLLLLQLLLLLLLLLLLPLLPLLRPGRAPLTCSCLSASAFCAHSPCLLPHPFPACTARGAAHLWQGASQRQHGHHHTVHHEVDANTTIAGSMKSHLKRLGLLDARARRQKFDTETRLS